MTEVRVTRAQDTGAVGNVADLVRGSAARDPGRTALVFGARSFTWAEVDRAVDAVATGLRATGLAAGDRIALCLGNTPDFPLTYFAALRAGLVAVPVNPTYTRRELAFVLADSGARAIVTADPAAAAGLGPTHVIAGQAAVDAERATHRLADLLAAAADPVESSGAGADLAVLCYTSGTEGSPRGAMLSHRALLANLDQCSRISPPVLQHDDTVLLVLPLFHIYGLNPGLGMVALHGATGVLAERFDPVATLELMDRHDVTAVLGAPPMYVAWSLLEDEDLLGRAFSRLRLALSGSAPLPASALSRLREATGHHVFEGYGLTETAPVLTSTLMSDTAKPDSIGRPVPGVELLLLDEGDGGLEADPDDPGEIAVRGPNLFSGYWPAGADGPDSDGWFGTGDVAYRDDDGDLHLVDRRRELVLVSGFNVYPREIEGVLMTHPGVAEAAVIGVRHPYTGETVKAFVVAESGAELTEEGVIAWCERSLARFKCPTVVEVVDQLPHSATGKVRKGELRERS